MMIKRSTAIKDLRTTCPICGARIVAKPTNRPSPQCPTASFVLCRDHFEYACCEHAQAMLDLHALAGCNTQGESFTSIEMIVVRRSK